ncbi:type II toxin-antitoxin system ParD family antitoxin [Methylomonas sp. CM2]|uniref:type II toxin-antitoxin system ParD family antitoxin n=1 Tax=Methylomonas sp. CM2 TaxID=3417647 RepID=UPI003CE9D5F4
MPTSVALSPHFEAFIRDQIASGRYNNTSEVVRAALRLMEEQQQRQALQLEALKAEIAAGKASGPGTPADSVFARLESKYQQQFDSQ